MLTELPRMLDPKVKEKRMRSGVNGGKIKGEKEKHNRREKMKL